MKPSPEAGRTLLWLEPLGQNDSLTKGYYDFNGTIVSTIEACIFLKRALEVLLKVRKDAVLYDDETISGALEAERKNFQINLLKRG
jgi:hypothetical protein